MKVRYARVSTPSQEVESQFNDNLPLYADTISGAVPLSERPDGGRLLQDIEKGKVSEVVIYSISRLGRSTRDILETVEYMASKGVNVIAESEGLSTLVEGKINPTAKMVLSIMATLAEHEREMISERRKIGIEKAKERGAYRANGGARRKPDDPAVFLNKHRKAVKLLKQGRSLREVGQLAGISHVTAGKVKRVAEDQGRI
jgi:DNA invertase Pin-like site-specific DNA recombinase